MPTEIEDTDGDSSTSSFRSQPSADLEEGYRRVSTSERVKEGERQQRSRDRENGRCHRTTILATCLFLLLFYFGVKSVLPEPTEEASAVEYRIKDEEAALTEYPLSTRWRAPPAGVSPSISCSSLLTWSGAVSASPSPLLFSSATDSSCSTLRSRVLPFRSLNNGFPLAFSKAVYTDYELVEQQLAVSFSFENSFCFVVDSKATRPFVDRMNLLASCFPNVFIAAGDFNLDRFGHHQNRGHLSCMRTLMLRPWKYLLIMQNHDILLKSNLELTRIFSLLNGTSDIEVTECRKKRCEPRLDADIHRLQLCRESEECKQRKRLFWAKGAQQSSLSREAVHFILHGLNVDPLVKMINFLDEGVDEILLASLAVSSIGFPGGYTSRCLPRRNSFISRYSNWQEHPEGCKSGFLRHYICILDVRDLPRLASSRFLLANKMWPSHDFSSIHCMAELVFNRSRLFTPPFIDSSFYFNLPAVRYNRLMRERGVNGTEEFKC